MQILSNIKRTKTPKWDWTGPPTHTEKEGGKGRGGGRVTARELPQPLKAISDPVRTGL